MDELIGKKAYKRHGYLEGVIGVVERSKVDITPTPYVINTPVGRVGAHERDIVIVEEGE